MRLLLGATVLALAPLAAHALDEGACRVGSLGQVVGEASVVRGNASRAARPDAPVCPGDRIVTGARSVVELQFPDGTRITVGKDSEFAIERWQERRLRRDGGGSERHRGVAAAPAKDHHALPSSAPLRPCSEVLIFPGPKPTAAWPPVPQNPCFSISR